MTNLSTFVEEMNRKRLEAYTAQPLDVREHAETENEVLSGGYAYRQLYELIQNAADAILESDDSHGRIVVRLSPDKLVVANTGAELDKDGVIALLMARSSTKRSNQIGRFGIGFKSLLKLGGQVDIVSKTVGLRFDPSWCGERIRNHIGLSSEDAVPGMRLAKPLDPASKNSPLRGGSEWDWATTVVLADIRNERVFERLKDEIKKFPSEFLLFLSTNVSLELEIYGEETRKIARHVTGDIVVVGDGTVDSKWKVFEQSVEITNQDAVEDATHLQARKNVPISWAVQVGGGREVAGRFWAFFPTETPSRTSGILNAPWKLNADRTSLIKGSWNEEVMKACATLIGSSLTKLSTPDDYGVVVDAFPRQAERQDEISNTLTSALWRYILDSKVLPNADCEFLHSSQLNRHSVEDSDICASWKNFASKDSRKQYLHPDCTSSETRISRLNALSEVAAQQGREVLPESGLNEWLSCIASTNPSVAKDVVLFAGRLVEDHMCEVSEASIILTSDGNVTSSVRSAIVMHDDPPAGLFAVHNEIVLDPRCKEVLVRHLKIIEISPESWSEILHTSYHSAVNSENGSDWNNFWKNVCSAPKSEVEAFFDDDDYALGVMKFLSASGKWVDREMLVVAESSDEVDSDYVMDLDFKREIETQIPEEFMVEFFDLIDDLGYYDDPIQDYMNKVFLGFKYVCSLERTSTPRSLPYLKGRGALDMPGCWRLLPFLSSALASKLTMHLIDHCIDIAEKGSQVTAVHTQINKYPHVKVLHPLYFWIIQKGKFNIEETDVPIRIFSVALADSLEEIGINDFRKISTFLKYVDSMWDERIPYNAKQLLHPYSYKDDDKEANSIQAFWRYIFRMVESQTENFGNLRTIWEGAVTYGIIPKAIPTSNGPCPLSEIFVSGDQHLSGALDDSGKVVVLSDEAATAWIDAGAKCLNEKSVLTSSKKISEPVQLLDIFPGMLRVSKKIKKVDRISVLWVENLREKIGPSSLSVLAGFDSDRVLLIDKEKFEIEEYEKVITQIVDCLERNNHIKAGSKSEIIELVLNHRVVERKEAIRREASLEAKVLTAIGGDTDVLIDVLPDSARRALNEGIGQKDLAGLALAVHGPAILSKIRDSLADNDLLPPKRWGGSQAQQFVLDLGFPIGFASSVTKRREPEVLISGPISLPDLHDYQKDILENIEKLLKGTKKRRRAVISLPTGAGKTRVAAQAVVELVLKGTGPHSALWIAQTDELCEQAVQCFRQLWVNVGEPGANLRIVRLWGGQKNPVQSDDLDATLIVASIQTLSSRSGNDDLEWITRPGVIVIDECHHAISPSYTNFLKWLGLQTGREKERDAEVPVLGLSATPWRGYNDEESDRLAARFDKRWFPEGQERLHERLTETKVLATRRYFALSYKKEFMLTERELQYVENFTELPDSAMVRIGEDDDRNSLIVESILASEAESILLFANSVAHAQYLAAQLHLKGCPAAAVSGETDQLARQHFTRRFRTGDLRVVCNHSVLATGFDAPKVDSILISRPVFSPVRYMQMVGRGLRGPANGGTEHCEIVTVEDNIVNYRERLAYHYCKRFFEK